MTKLKKSLSLVHLVFYGVGTIVGAGIYSVIGAAAGEAGSLLWLSFLLAGAVALLTVLSYAELSSMFTSAGAEYQYLKHAFSSPFLPFMAGTLVLFNAAATAATVSLSFAGYLDVFLNQAHMLTAFVLLAICTAINIAGIRQSTWASMTLVSIEVIGLMLLVFAAFKWGNMQNNLDFTTVQETLGAPGLLSGAALIFFVYIGFEDVANLSEEAHRPERNIPRALLISILLTTVLYVLVALSVVALADPVGLALSPSPLTEVGWIVAPWMGDALAVAALFSTASTALITLISISRLLFGMGRSGVMPKITARVLEKRQTPWVAALFLFSGAALFLLLGDIKTVASVTSLGALLVFISIHAAVIALRYKKPDLTRPFRTPFSAGRLPLVPVIGILVSLVLLTQLEIVVYAIEAAIIAFGALLYKVSQSRNI